uniref:Neural precursor cell expressed, developmentally down-regulated 9 n=1 Tax=Paramormyrops kingsleyae TaxID=1676925 RepID=A0A3B3RI30_9TELE
MKYEGLMARALYDNVPESPEELAFRKGDILTVLEQNTGGVEGWWLCSLHGRQGIAPGNRLKLLVGPTLGMVHPDPASQPKGPVRQEGLYQVPLGQDVYQVPQCGGRAAEGFPGKVRSANGLPLRVCVQKDVYDIPRGAPPSRSWDVTDGLIYSISVGLNSYKGYESGGKEEFEQQQQALLQKESIMKQGRLQLEKEQLKQFKKLEQEVIKPVEVTKPVENDTGQQAASQNSVADPTSMVGGAPICGRDRQLLRFYSEQCGTHFDTLLSAVDAFFACVREGQPPRVFVAHSKLVILSAHKLVFIGDTLSRQAATPEVAQRALDGSNALCQMLKAVVGATKMAALRYPNTAPLQEMVDRVAVLSHLAQQFQAQLLCMAES